MESILQLPLTSPRKSRTAIAKNADVLIPCAALAWAKSQAYQDATYAPSTLRTYAVDLANHLGLLYCLYPAATTAASLRMVSA